MAKGQNCDMSKLLAAGGKPTCQPSPEETSLGDPEFHRVFGMFCNSNPQWNGRVGLVVQDGKSILFGWISTKTPWNPIELEIYHHFCSVVEYPQLLICPQKKYWHITRAIFIVGDSKRSQRPSWKPELGAPLPVISRFSLDFNEGFKMI